MRFSSSPSSPHRHQQVRGVQTCFTFAHGRSSSSTFDMILRH
jgi:hypothetical protein